MTATLATVEQTIQTSAASPQSIAGDAGGLRAGAGPAITYVVAEKKGPPIRRPSILNRIAIPSAKRSQILIEFGGQTASEGCFTSRFFHKDLIGLMKSLDMDHLLSLIETYRKNAVRRDRAQEGNG